jgi:hypothetical protein
MSKYERDIPKILGHPLEYILQFLIFLKNFPPYFPDYERYAAPIFRCSSLMKLIYLISACHNSSLVIEQQAGEWMTLRVHVLNMLLCVRNSPESYHVLYCGITMVVERSKGQMSNGKVLTQKVSKRKM